MERLSIFQFLGAFLLLVAAAAGAMIVWLCKRASLVDYALSKYQLVIGRRSLFFITLF
jgi:hypothetical protein